MLAAGAGSRMKLTVNKVFLPLGKARRPVLQYPLAVICGNPRIDEVVIVTRTEDRERLETVCAHESCSGKPMRIAEGGAQRFDSVRNALAQVADGIVIIHDGARPLLKQQYINSCIEAMDTEVGATVAVPCTDDLWDVSGEGFLAQKKGSAGLYRIQTPQCFRADILKECHERVTDKSAVTDDCALLELCGYRVKLLPGGESNIKLTYASDMLLAAQYIDTDAQTRPPG